MEESRPKGMKMARWSIKWKLMSMITVLVVSLVAILSYTQISAQKKILEVERDHRIALMRANLVERGKAFIITLSQQLENDLASFNLSGAVDAIRSSVESTKEIKYAMLVDASGVVFVHTGKPDLAQTQITGERDKAALNAKGVTVSETNEGNEPVIEIINPLQISTKPWGVLTLVYTLGLLEAEIEQSRKQIRHEIDRMIYRATLTSLAFLVGCLIIVIFLSAKFSRPLIDLTESARKLSKGDFSVSSDIKIRSRDEVGVLGASFVEMSRNLEGSYKKLEEYSNRYRALFEYSPISLWEEDFSQVKIHMGRLREKGIEDFSKYFEEHPEELSDCIGMIRVLDVNESSLRLYEADNKEALSRSLDKILGEASNEILGRQLVAIAQGKPFELQCVNRTLSSREMTVLMKASVPPGYEDTWSRVLVSVHDLSERMRAEFLKDMFGRYLSEEVTNSLLDNPDLVKLGGEKRSVTIMVSDLRGFTSLAERLEPEKVVQLLNGYFEVMVDVLLKYSATINEIIGDSLLVIFGAPQEMSDRGQRAIACAIEMQNAMAKVNEHNRGQGLPEIEMGIGLNEAEVIVGNIGSSKRIKYGVVGSGVNMTSRIESYTVGGQIFVSESVRQQAGDILRIDSQRDVFPKGSEASLRIYEVGGIAGSHHLALQGKALALVTLTRQVPLRYAVLEGKDVGKVGLEGAVVRLSKNCIEVILDTPVEMMTNLKMNLAAVDEKLSTRSFYGKVVKRSGEEDHIHLVHFTSVPPEIDAYFQAYIQFACHDKSCAP